MAYDSYLAERILIILKQKRIIFSEKKMFGGMCYMVDNKMCLGVVKNDLMARIHLDSYEKALKKKGCEPMLFTGKLMKGYVFINPIGVDLDKDLEYWIQQCLDFNPLAKASKKKN